MLSVRRSPSSTTTSMSSQRGNVSPPCARTRYVPGGTSRTYSPSLVVCVSAIFLPSGSNAAMFVTYPFGAHRGFGGICSVGQVGVSTTYPCKIDVPDNASSMRGISPGHAENSHAGPWRPTTEPSGHSFPSPSHSYVAFWEAAGTPLLAVERFLYARKPNIKSAQAAVMRIKVRRDIATLYR